MGNMYCDIFISYERGSGDWALAINDAAKGRYGTNKVFIDVEDIKTGANWPKRLEKQVTQCKVFLLVINSEWSEPHLLKKLSDKKNWVHKEILLAHKCNKIIFPVLVGGAVFPSKLPDGIGSILNQTQATQWPAIQARLFSDIDKHLQFKRATSQQESQLLEAHQSTICRLDRLGGEESTTSVLYPAARQAISDYEQRTCRRLPVLGDEYALEMGTNYQSLPLLLQHIQADKLPNALESSPRQVEGNEHIVSSNLRELEIRRWEEEQSRKTNTNLIPTCLEDLFIHFKETVEEVDSSVPHLLLLAPPGNGKTTLLRYLAWRVSKHEAKSPSDGLWCDPLIPVSIYLPEWQKSGLGLAHYLERHYISHGVLNGPNPPMWHDLLSNSDVLLLLDGLDELELNQSEVFRRRFRDVLDSYASCPTVITCRTVSYQAYSQWLPPSQFAILYLDGLTMQQQEIFIETFAPRFISTDSQALIAQFKANPCMHTLGANPLLLSIICFVVANGVRLPATRAELYIHAVEKLLSRSCQKDSVIDHYSLETSDLTNYLTSMAFNLFAGTDGRRLRFKRAEVQLALKTALREHDDSAEMANGLIAIYESKGILRKSGDTYFFLHLTLHEYLTSKAVAEKVNLDGMSSEIKIRRSCCTVLEWFSRKCWDPTWQEVILFTIGQLDDPSPVWELLADRGQDDFFRHRLALAARSFVEVPRVVLQTHQENINHVRSQVTQYWWCLVKRHGMLTKYIVPHFHQSLLALYTTCPQEIDDWVRTLWAKRSNHSPLAETLDMLGRQGVSDELFSILVELVREGSGSAQRAIQNMGDFASSDEHLRYLANILSGENRKLQITALNILKILGPSAANAQVVQSTIGLLASNDKIVRGTAQEVLRLMGKAANCSQFVQGLVSDKKDTQKNLQAIKALDSIGVAGASALTEFLSLDIIGVIAAGSLRRMGGAAATKEVLGSLVSKMKDPSASQLAKFVLEGMGVAAIRSVIDELQELVPDHNWGVSIAACSVLIKVDPANLQVLNKLEELLICENRTVVKDVLDILGCIGPTAATNKIVRQLETLLSNNDGWIRNSALKAAIHMKVAKKNKEIMGRLEFLLQDEEPFVQLTAIESISMIGAEASTREVLRLLVNFLSHDGWKMQQSAATALGTLGASAATAEVLEQLAALLKKEDSFWSPLPRLSATALCGMGAAAANEEIVMALVMLLRCSRSREEAEKALNSMGAAAVSDSVLRHLVDMLGHEDKSAQRAAAKAFELMGESAASVAVVRALAKSLSDCHPDARWCVMTALEEMGPVAATEEVVLKLVQLIPVSRDGWAAVSALCSMGPEAVSDIVVQNLSELLTDDDWHVSVAAANILAAMGSEAATDEVTRGLKVLLEAKTCSERFAAAKALFAMGAVATYSSVFRSLTELLTNKELQVNVRDCALEVIATQHEAAATDEMRERLVDLLSDEHLFIRINAVRAISIIFSNAANNETIESVATCLRDENQSVRDAVLDYLQTIGAKAMTPTVINELVLCDELKSLSKLLATSSSYVFFQDNHTIPVISSFDELA